jgi:multidrug efflux pump subunit AcrB
VVTESNEATISILDEYTKPFSNRFPNASVKWKQLEMTPSKAPIEIRISGDSIHAIKQVANQIMDKIRAVKGLYWIRTDYREQLQTIDLALKSDEATRLGYSSTLLGYSLMVGTKGFPIATVWEGDYPVEVRLKVDKPKKTSINDLENQYVTSPYLASSVQLRQIADLKPGWCEGNIVRRNGVRTITVMAEVDRDSYADDVFKKIQPLVDNTPLPEGVHLEYGGDHADSAEYITPIFYAFMISVAIIFLILMFQFRSIKTSFLIMMTMPLSLFGAAFGCAVTGYPFSVTAFIGLVGLMGIVVRNGIIYISYAEELRRSHGHSLMDAAIAAAKRRMRPIFLTCAAAAMGVVPMIMSRSSLWGPLGSVVCFGLIFGMLLSLFVMPVLYYLFHKNDEEKAEEVPCA